MRNFQDIFEICKWSLISVFSICMTLPLKYTPRSIVCKNIAQALSVSYEGVKQQNVYLRLVLNK